MTTETPLDADKDLSHFLLFVNENADARQELQSVFESGISYDAATTKIIDMGREFGYTFTADEVEELIDEALSNQGLKGELSDEQLEAIAGGSGKGSAIFGIFELAFDALIGLAVSAATGDD